MMELLTLSMEASIWDLVNDPNLMATGEDGNVDGLVTWELSLLHHTASATEATICQSSISCSVLPSPVNKTLDLLHLKQRLDGAGSHPSCLTLKSPKVMV